MSDHGSARRVASRHTSALAALRWALTRRPQRWPRWIDSSPGPTPPPRVATGIRYTVVNHSTVLVQVDGCNLLFDPIWSARCSPLRFVGPRRVRAPGLRLAQLPPIDAVLVSHNHYDHLDLPTLGRLARTSAPRFYVGAGDGALLRRHGLGPVVEMSWWEEQQLPSGLAVTYVPGQHFSGRGAIDRNRSLWGGYVVGSSEGPIYFSGDTGYAPIFADIGQRLGPMVLSFVPIGAYLPRWFMGSVHVDPHQAVQIHLDVQSRRSVAVHFGTFQLTDEGIDEPPHLLADARARHRLGADVFRLPHFGAEGWAES